MTDQDSNEYRQQRLANMEKLEELGYPAYGKAFDRSGRVAGIKAEFAEEKEVRACGRLIRSRKMGKSIFADIHDGSERIQLYAQKNVMGEEAFAAFKLLDVGDHIGVSGPLFLTRTEEQTIKVENWTLLAKSLLPLPEKWHGLQDVDARYRQRYLDLVSNQDVRELFNKRIKAVREIRSFLVDRGFMEVETPIMQPHAGGAAAKPFATHYGALNLDMYLRIAPELYLKRLLVGGFDKVFELNRSFRNEGVDRTHNPEFTMLEIYEAYSDVDGMKELIRDLIIHVAGTVYGTQQVGTEDAPIDLAVPWKEISYRELVTERMGEDWYTLGIDEARKRAEAEGLDIDPSWDMLLISHEVYEKLVERTLIQPTFVTRLPAALIPLARACEDDPSLADVFELVIGGQEIAPAYTEMNNPLEQRARLSEQAGENAEKIDEDFLKALEHGMPPAGGMGVGIDRLVMLMSGVDALRDVILFPQLKPKV
ncbi:MAG: lysine--tRNA ligase [Kiritimatiellia bacterium]|jgi:lysyl-tRNA synthetase class 2|nr:lysine--tRNA ligase [Kiritimatiellia bacterium]